MDLKGNYQEACYIIILQKPLSFSNRDIINKILRCSLKTNKFHYNNTLHASKPLIYGTRLSIIIIQIRSYIIAYCCF